ncbi:hypothetical protein [Capnocytophaga leadbetteri]|nr:hypothetical protein [Capnocytophaga leadbetteri]
MRHFFQRRGCFSTDKRVSVFITTLFAPDNLYFLQRGQFFRELYI